MAAEHGYMTIEHTALTAPHVEHGEPLYPDLGRLASQLLIGPNLYFVDKEILLECEVMQMMYWPDHPMSAIAPTKKRPSSGTCLPGDFVARALYPWAGRLHEHRFIENTRRRDNCVRFFAGRCS